MKDRKKRRGMKKDWMEIGSQERKRGKEGGGRRTKGAKFRSSY